MYFKYAYRILKKNVVWTVCEIVSLTKFGGDTLFLHCTIFMSNNVA